MNKIIQQGPQYTPQDRGPVHCRFCLLSIKNQPYNLSPKNNHNHSISKLNETQTSAFNKSAENYESAKPIPSSHIQSHSIKHQSIPQFQSTTNKEEEEHSKDEIVQVHICKECLFQLKKLHQNYKKQKQTYKENFKTNQPKQFLRKQYVQSEKSFFQVDEKVNDSNNQKKDAENLSELIVEGFEFKQTNKDYVLEREQSCRQEQKQSFELESVGDRQNKSLPNSDKNFLQLQSKLDISFDQEQQQSKFKKMIVEGFPKNKSLKSYLGHRSISIVVENERIQMNFIRKRTKACHYCDYQVYVQEKKNFSYKKVNVCRLCFTLKNYSKQIISFETQKNRERIASRTKRSETVTKGFSGFRNRIISTPGYESTSVEKPQAIDRKQMVPREKLNKKNISRQIECGSCKRKGLTVIKTSENNLCLNCYYMKRQN